jgi:peptidyl-prolyl cis-trans isomerase B (cyclophilin B)
MMRAAIQIVSVIILLSVSMVAPSLLMAAEAQNGAQNIVVRLEGSRAVVSFDLPGDQNVGVDIVFSDDRGPLKVSPESLSGDVGGAVSPGTGKNINWEFLKDHPYGLMAKVLDAKINLSEAKTVKAAPQVKGDKMTKIKLETSMGVIVAELDAGKAPITVENVLAYVRSGFYDGTIFHRVIEGFMVQGGGFDDNMQMGDTRPPIKNEAGNGLKNLTGTLAMARTSDVDSATAQFFINLADNGFLDHTSEAASGFGYAVFGKVVEGMDVVEKIGKVQTGNYRGFADVPSEHVVIEKVSVLE